MSEAREGIAHRVARSWFEQRPSALDEVLAEWRFLKWDTSTPYWNQSFDERWFHDNPDRQYRIRTSNCVENDNHSDLYSLWTVHGQRMLFVIVARTDTTPVRYLFWSRRRDFLRFSDDQIAELLEYLAAYIPEGAMRQ